MSITRTPAPGRPLDLGLLDNAQETAPRWAVNSNVAMSTGNLRLGYFTARTTFTVGNLRMNTAGTAAAATPTLVRIGLYSVAVNGNLTLMSACVSDTTLFAAATTVYTRSLAAPQGIVAGLRYAIGALVVTAAAAPTVAANVVSVAAAEMGQSPVLAKLLAAQSDLPSTVTTGLVDTTAAIYAVALP